MNREELIEEAANAMSQGYVKDGRISSFFALAEAALSVFEKAQAPTDEEREALAEVLHYAQGFDDWGVANETDREGSLDIADAVLAAGFRRPAQGDYYEGFEEGVTVGRGIATQTKPTDAQVERAARSIAEWNTSDVPHELCRAVARDALRAAFTAGQEEQS